MSQIIAVGMMVLLSGITCQGQATLKQPQKSTPVSLFRASRGKSEMDGEHWTVLTVPAKNAFQNVIGMTIRPELHIWCVQKAEDVKFFVDLESGPVEHPPGGVGMRVKLDNGAPRDTSWYGLLNKKSYRYTSGPNSLDIFDDQKNTPAFLLELFATKIVRIEFYPFMVGGAFVATFDVQGLRSEFGKYSECKLNPVPPPAPPATQ